MTDIAQTTNLIRHRLRIVLGTPWTITLTVPFMVLVMDAANFVPVIEFAAGALINTLPYILFAVLMIAALKASGAQTIIADAFKGRETRMIILAALFGGLAPFCSCEVIPFIAGLLALGVPLSAVMAFWLSSPLIDPPAFLITAAALGWPFAIGKAISGVGLGLFGGFLVKLSLHAGLFQDPLRTGHRNSCGNTSGCASDSSTGKPVWTFWRNASRRREFRAEFITNALFLLKWLALAYVLEALLVTYVPAELIAGLVGGPGIGPIVVAALVGMPAYLNSYAAPALLAGLVDQGMTAGAAMAFMAAGAVSSVPAMAAVWSLVKPRVFAIYLGLGITGAIISGLLFQMVLGSGMWQT